MGLFATYLRICAYWNLHMLGQSGGSSSVRWGLLPSSNTISHRAYVVKVQLLHLLLWHWHSNIIISVVGPMQLSLFNPCVTGHPRIVSDRQVVMEGEGNQSLIDNRQLLNKSDRNNRQGSHCAGQHTARHIFIKESTGQHFRSDVSIQMNTIHAFSVSNMLTNCTWQHLL